MRFVKLNTDSGRQTFINVEQVIYVGEDPMSESRTEIMTSEGVFFCKKKAAEVVALLSDGKTKEI